MKKKAVVLLAGLLVPFCSGCASISASSSSYPSGLYYAFDTTVTVSLYDGTNAILDEIGGYLSEFSGLTDAFTVPSSGQTTLYTLNHTNAEITVPAELAGILSYALEMEQETDGYFNPLIGNLAVLWKDGIEAAVPCVPAQSAIAAALQEMKASSLIVNGDKVRRSGSATIDLGAIAKGYSLRKVLAILETNNVQSYFVNAGSSSMIMGKKPSGDGKWRIGFNVGSGKATPAVLTLASSAMGTSSDTEQGAVIEGKAYTHIVNPFTGSALASYVLASAVNPDPGLDDVMSTCFFLMGETIAKTYAEKMNLGYCFYDGSAFTHSSGLEVTLN